MLLTAFPGRHITVHDQNKKANKKGEKNLNHRKNTNATPAKDTSPEINDIGITLYYNFKMYVNGAIVYSGKLLEGTLLTI